jgi:hypothetical protein
MIERRKLLGLGLGVLGASAVGPMAAFAQSKLGVSDPIGDLLQSQSDLAEGLPAEGLPAAAPRRSRLRSCGPRPPRTLPAG